MVLPAFATIVCIVFGLALVFCVLGVTIGRSFHWQWLLRQGPGFNAVVGLSGSILFFEVWNFLFPVNRASGAVLGGLTLALAIIFRRTLMRVTLNWLQKRSISAMVLLLALLLTVSLFGLYPGDHENYDTGLYYLNSIRWAREYPVVPGLANLHGRLGFNQSLFPFIASLSSLPHFGLARACQVVNPLFVFISGWAILDRFRVNLATAKAKRVRLYVILLVCPLAFFASNTLISAPTPDIAAAALALPGALVFFNCLELISERNRVESANWTLLLAVCCCTIAKLKLSYALFGILAVSGACVGLFSIQLSEFFWTWIRIAVVAIVLIVPWLARGIILSGCPFYPSTFLRFRTDWAVPQKAAEWDRDWIYSWARLPEKEPADVLKNKDWFGPWMQRNGQDPKNIFLLLFLAAGLGLAPLSLLAPMKPGRRLVTLLLIAQTLLAAIFWFKVAPEPRFAYATLLLLGVNGFYAACFALSQASTIRSSIFTFLITAVSVSQILRNEWPLIYHAEKKFPQGFPKAEIEYQTTNYGLRVGLPTDEQSWDSGLVVTPYFNPNLMLRGRELREGFRVRGPWSPPL